jgi:hypothetical protein
LFLRSKQLFKISDDFFKLFSSSFFNSLKLLKLRNIFNPIKKVIDTQINSCCNLSIYYLFIGLKIFRNFNNFKELKNEEENNLKKSSEILNNCFDLKNKSQRSLNDSMKLIEYCLDKYGFKN